MHDERLSEIKAREAITTPGPWIAHEGQVRHGKDIQDQPDTLICSCWKEDGAWGTGQEIRDAHFIAAAREDILYLIHRVECLTAENLRLRAVSV